MSSSAPNLTEIQRLFMRAISNPLSDLRDASPQLSDGSSYQALAERIVRPNDRLSGAERLELYNRQYWFRLLDCLWDDYPGVRAVLGKKRFMSLCEAYLQAHPSRCFTLRELGRNLPAFIKENYKFCGDRPRAAYEMATVEWAHIEAFDGAVNDPFVPAPGQPPPPRLTVQPYLSLLQIHYPFDEMLIVLRSVERERTEAVSKKIIGGGPGRFVRTLPKPAPRYLAVHRVDLGVYYKQLARPQFVLLAELRAGASLEQACLKALETGEIREEPARWVESQFTLFARLNWLCVPSEEQDETARR